MTKDVAQLAQLVSLVHFPIALIPTTRSPSQSETPCRLSAMDLSAAKTIVEGLLLLLRTISNKLRLVEEKAVTRKLVAAVGSLGAGVSDIRALFNTTIALGNFGSLSALLSSTDGEAAYSQLNLALKEAETMLKKQNKKLEILLEFQARTPLNRLAELSVVGLTATSGIIEVVEGDVSAVEESHREVSRAYHLFRNLLSIQGNDTLPKEPTDYLSNTQADEAKLGLGTLLDAVQMDFQESPFQVSLGKNNPKTVNRLHALNSTRDWSEKHVETMQQAGRRWVGQQLLNNEPPDVSFLGRLQIHLLKLVRDVIEGSLVCGDGESASGPRDVQSRDGPVNTRLLVPALTALKENIDRALRRAENQCFSIAFCGMVKAGYVL
jgi:hypothetical protein